MMTASGNRGNSREQSGGKCGRVVNKQKQQKVRFFIHRRHHRHCRGETNNYHGEKTNSIFTIYYATADTRLICYLRRLR